MDIPWQREGGQDSKARDLVEQTVGFVDWIDIDFIV